MLRNQVSQYSSKNNYKIVFGVLVQIQEPVPKQNFGFRSRSRLAKINTKNKNYSKKNQNVTTKYQKCNKKLKIVFQIANRNNKIFINSKIIISQKS